MLEHLQPEQLPFRALLLFCDAHSAPLPFEILQQAKSHYLNCTISKTICEGASECFDYKKQKNKQTNSQADVGLARFSKYYVTFIMTHGSSNL